MTLAAVGDICGATIQARANCEATGDLVVSEDPDLVAVLGDLAYPNGTSADFAFYDARWGAGNSPSFLDITRPVPGNHEYNDPAVGPGAEGYRAQFPDAYAPPTGRLYYSYDVGNWHVVALDTDRCQSGEGCPQINTVNTAQVQWMIADLAADTHTCDIAYGHHPAYSSPDGPTSNRHGSIPYLQPAWDQMVAAGVDIYLSGHDHDYERFAPMNANGAAVAAGTRQFVIGTGGSALDTFDAILPTSEFRYSGLGITIFTLGEDSYSWRFVSTTGETIDQGGPIACH